MFNLSQLSCQAAFIFTGYLPIHLTGKENASTEIWKVNSKFCVIKFN